MAKTRVLRWMSTSAAGRWGEKVTVAPGFERISRTQHCDQDLLLVQHQSAERQHEEAEDRAVTRSWKTELACAPPSAGCSTWNIGHEAVAESPVSGWGARVRAMTTSTSERTQSLLNAFAQAVRDSPHNLLSRRALEELEDRHIAESVAFAASLPADATVLDLGTGGGFPGMVIAITRPDLEVTLLDSTGKKILFLREFADEHDLAVETLRGRAEDLQSEHSGAFDIVTARAVAPLDQLAVWALPFLRPGGRLHAIKGERWPEELKEALPVLQRLGARVVSVPGHDDGAVSTDSDELSPAMPRVVIIQAAG